MKFGLDILIKWKRLRKFLDKFLEVEKKIFLEVMNILKIVFWVCIILIVLFMKLVELLKLLINLMNFVGFGFLLRWKRRKLIYCVI